MRGDSLNSLCNLSQAKMTIAEVLANALQAAVKQYWPDADVEDFEYTRLRGKKMEVQQTLFPDSPLKDFSRAKIHGETFNEVKDGKRLRSHLQRVHDAMKSGEWFTLQRLAALTHGSEAGTSARIRDLRKTANGGYVIERERVSGGVFRYRLLSK